MYLIDLLSIRNSYNDPDQKTKSEFATKACTTNRGVRYLTIDARGGCKITKLNAPCHPLDLESYQIFVA
jgi:hypothetical protein